MKEEMLIMDAMDCESRFCLICQRIFTIEADNIPISIVNSKILFDNCIRLLRVDEESYNKEYKWKWDGQFDLPNFCSNCAEDIALLSVLDEDLNIINEEISENLRKIIPLILNWTSDVNRNFPATTPDVFSSVDVSATTKIQYYRRNAVRDWNPVVLLSRCDEKNISNDIIDLRETKEVVPLSAKDEEDNFFTNLGYQFKCKICFAVIKEKQNMIRHIDTVHRKIKRFECNICGLKYSTKLYCKIHINTKHRKPVSTTPLPVAKLYAKSSYFVESGATKDELVIPNDTPFVKPLIIKCEAREEINVCLICDKILDDGGAQISPDLFASLSHSLKVSQWKHWQEFSNLPTDWALLCESCFGFTTDLHSNRKEFDETQRKFEKLFIKVKTNIISSMPIVQHFPMAFLSSQSIAKPISVAEKANYFRSYAVQELNPILCLVKVENMKNESQQLQCKPWRTPQENSIFKLVKPEEIIDLDPEIMDEIVVLTEDEVVFYFQYEGGRYLCRQCNTCYASIRSATNHCNSKHKHIRRCQCKYCHKQFYHKHQCASHIVSMHKLERAEIEEEIGKSMAKSRGSKMTSVDGVIRISNKEMPSLPPNSIIRMGNKFKCTICSGIYKRRNIIVEHQKIAHLKSFRYKCEFCDLKNHHRHPIVIHVRNVHPEKLTYNDENPQPFLPKRISRPKLKRDPSTLPGVKVLEVKIRPNIEEHIIVNGCRYGCKFCGKDFIQRLTIVEHVEGVHFGVRNFQCKICDKKFYNLNHCQRHFRKCKLFGKTLHQKEDPNIIKVVEPYQIKHLEAYEEDKKRATACVRVTETQPAQEAEDPLSADVQFQDDEETPVEIPMHGELDIKVMPFTLGFDNQYYPDPEILESSKSLNSVESNQQSVSNQISEIKAQNSTAVSEESKEMIFGSDNKKGTARFRDPIFDVIKPGNVIELPKNKNYEEELQKGFKKAHKGYECLKCGKISSRFTIFRQHWGSIHATSGGYECSICQKRFYFRYKCAQHYITKHTNLNPYGCKICDKKFSSPFALEYHVKLHLDERPFSCSSCSLKFISENSLQQHIDQKHMIILGT